MASRERLWLLRATLARLADATRAAAAAVVAEIRRLNGVGAEARSRDERVRAVKSALGRRSDGPRRCC
ncbi:MAG TPA: hypothetical protein VFB33_00900 [Candidatus Binataceae bacterium]|jgi:hypothetical protein|nr:hypothetical protein [Candidatus Binataceae bacterium]